MRQRSAKFVKKLVLMPLLTTVTGSQMSILYRKNGILKRVVYFLQNIRI